MYYTPVIHTIVKPALKHSSLLSGQLIIIYYAGVMLTIDENLP